MALFGKTVPVPDTPKFAVTCRRCGREIVLRAADRPKAEFAVPCDTCGRRLFYQPSDVKTLKRNS